MAAPKMKKIFESSLLVKRLSQVNCCRFAYTERKSRFQVLSAVRRKNNPEVGAAIKRYNWENLYLFGPVLRRDGKNVLSENKVAAFRYKDQPIPVVKLGDARNATTVNLSNWAVDPAQIFNELNKNLATNTPILYPFSANSTDPFINEQYLKTRSTDLLQKGTECDLQIENLPTVSSILRKTMSADDVKEERETVLSTISQCNWHSFNKHKNDLYQIEVAIRKYMKLFFCPLKKDIRLPENVTPYWNSMLPFLYSLSDVNVNQQVIHPHLRYSGLADCIAIWQNHLVLIELLLPYNDSSIVRNLKDAPLRAAAYAGALNADPANSFEITEILLIIPSSDKSLAFVLNIENDVMLAYWNLWLERLKLYWEIRCELPLANYINFSYK